MGKTNKYSWSFSRSAALAECPRRAFYEYYSSGEPDFGSDAWRLKELVSLPMFAGSTVDYVISRGLDRIRAGADVSEMAEAGRRHFRKGLKRSTEIVNVMRRRARTMDERKSEPFHGLLHDYYELNLGVEYVELLESRVVECLTRFEESEVFERVRAAEPANWGTIAKVDEDVAPSFSLRGFKVYAAFDFVFYEDSELFILDWKTGADRCSAKETADRQLGVYALWAASARRHPINCIHTQAVWLQSDAEWQPRHVDRDELKRLRDGILAEIEAEQSLLSIKRFKNRTEYWAQLKDFPARPSGKICLNCKFREICAEGRGACSHVRVVA